MKSKVGTHIFEFRHNRRLYHVFLYESVLFTEPKFYIYVIPATLIRYVDSPGALSKHSACTLIKEKNDFRILKTNMEFPEDLRSQLSNLVEISYIQRM
jgi:hypothetical protein